MACEPGQYLDEASGICIGQVGAGDDWGVGAFPTEDGGWDEGSLQQQADRSWLEEGSAEGMDLQAAALLQSQFNQNREMYVPVAQSLSNWLGDPQAGEETIDKSRQAGLATGTSAMGSQNRDMQRYGNSLTKGQKQQFNTGLAMDRTAGGVGAANNTRQGLMDTRLSGLQSFIGMGHGLASGGIGGIASNASQMADMGVQNDMARRSAQQATQANQMQMAGTAASIAMMFI